MTNEIFLYNSLSKNKEKIEVGKTIKWYACGPTIYNNSHLGHARTFLTFDIVRRVLTHYGHNIIYVMNLTDIDDKIINKVNYLHSEDKEKSYKQRYFEFTQQMEQDFWRDIDSLNILRPTVVTRVTEYIPKMIKYIEKILENGHAYVSNGSVYFDSTKVDKYPFIIPNSDKFTKNEFVSEKRNLHDFVLWKAEKENDKNIAYDSPWGMGRVGWHLECSVMASDILGKDIDIHSGGIDLIFPHHQNEILQCQAFENNPNFSFAKYFLHSGHLNIKDIKMSQSLNNFILIKDFLNNSGTANELRMLFLLHHWHAPLNLDDKSVEQAKLFYEKISNFVKHLKFLIETENIISSKLDDSDLNFLEEFENFKVKNDTHLRDNINTNSVMLNFSDFISTTYVYLEKNYNISFIKDLYFYFMDILTMLGITFPVPEVSNDKLDIIKYSVDFRSEIRNVLIDNKKHVDPQIFHYLFSILDNFRSKLSISGINVEDRPGKPSKWTFK